MTKKVIKRTIEEQIISAQQKLSRLHKDKQKKISRTIFNSFFFLTLEPEILILLNKNLLNLKFQQELMNYVLNFEHFKEISIASKPDDNSLIGIRVDD